MSNDKIRELLQQLRQEIDSANVDPATLSLMRELDGDIRHVLESRESRIDALVNRAKSLEVRFAASHASVEKILRQVIDTLGKMGV